MLDIYRKAFEQTNISHFWGGETRVRVWDDYTLLLYFFLVVVVLILCVYIEKHKYYLKKMPKRKIVPRRQLLFYPLGLLLFFMGLRGLWVGMDTIVYSQTFESATSLHYVFEDSSTEPLYKLLQFLLRCFFSDSHIIIFLYSVLIIYFVGLTFFRYFKYINVFIAVSAFVCIYYFQSFNLLRISVAASFIFSQMHFLLENRFKKFSLVIFLATFFHFSSIVAFMPLGVYLIYRKRKTLAISVLLVISIIVIIATHFLGDYIMLFERYSGYITDNESSRTIGFALFLDYFPCLCGIYYIFKKKLSGTWSNLYVCYTLSALVVRLLSYFISAAGRLYFHFMPVTMLFLPYWLTYLKKRNRKLYKPMILISFVWLIVRLHLYFVGYLSADGIMPYYFFWNEK